MATRDHSRNQPVRAPAQEQHRVAIDRDDGVVGGKTSSTHRASE
jgi:hypothetical protein